MAEELKPLYLLTGSDRPKIERGLRRLRDHIDPDGVELLAGLDTSGADAGAASN